MDITADRIKKHIEEHDRLIDIFGMNIDQVGRESAEVSMTVGPDHLNAAFICHGAAIFALADVAFALASNCGGKMSLALEASINYMRPAPEGTRLVARAVGIHEGRRTGVYKVSVTDEQGGNIAFLKATAYRVDSVSLPDRHGRETA